MLLLRRLSLALRTSPDRAACAAFCREALWLFPALAALGLAGGIIRLAPTDDLPAFLRLAAIALIVPALAEELLFRAALLPHPAEPATLSQRRVAAVLSVALFVAWHPPQALLYGPTFAAMMLDPWFLACVALMGTACVRLYERTGSVWPNMLLHWLPIALWKGLLGGPSPWT